MTPEERIRQALKVTETGAMMQFDKDSLFAQALRDMLARHDASRAGKTPLDPGADEQGDR